MIDKVKKLIFKYDIVTKCVVASILTIGLIYLFDETFSRSFFLVLIVFIANFTLINRAVKAFNARRMRYSLWFAVPFSLAFWFGHKILDQGMTIKNFTIFDIPLIVVLVVVLCLMAICALGFIDKKQFTPKLIKDKNNKQWLVYAGLIFLCYLPLFLLFFPGIVSVDSAVQLRQAIGEGEWSNWHPVLHTLFLSAPVMLGFSLFGDLTAGIALATLLQMVIVCLIFGYVGHWAIKKTGRRWIGYALIAFFALCPITACYAITMWKDILFSTLFLLLVVKVYDLICNYQREEKINIKNMLLVFFVAMLVAFFRNGGILIFIVLGVALLVYCKRSRKYIGLATIVGSVVILLVQGPIYDFAGITASPFMESMSIPAQQIGYVASQNDLSDSEKAMLSKYVNVDKLAESYTPMDADPAKNCFDYYAVEQDKGGFLRAWTEVLKSHFGSYAMAYILHIYPYWYIQSESWALDLGHTHDDVWLKQEYTDVSLLGDWLRDFIRRVEYGLMNTAWLGWLSSVGVLVWGLIAMVVIFLYQKRYYMLVVLSCILAYVASLLVASPVPGIFRYMYSVLLVMPILVIICFIKNKNGGKR